jgi:hypothetical protein
MLVYDVVLEQEGETSLLGTWTDQNDALDFIATQYAVDPLGGDTWELEAATLKLVERDVEA